MFLGRFLQGEVLRINALCVDLNDGPATPAEPPAILIYGPNGATRILADRMALIDKARAPGMASFVMHLGPLSPGQYSVVIHYHLGGTAYGRTHHFVVLPGGDPNGTIVSMYSMARPARTVLVQMTDAGTRVLGTNPGV